MVFASCKTANMASTHSGVKYKTQQVIVASYKADCVGVGPQTCFLYKKNPEDEWIFFYSEIEGFSYEPGFEYVITVKTSADGNDYQDASNLKFELVEVISKTPDKEVSSPLNDTWGLIEMNGTKVDISQLARSPMIDINTLRKRFQGSTGCNSFSTTFSYTDEGSFKVDFPFAMTKMACPDYDIENDFLKALESVDAYQMEGINLLLLSQGEVVLRYRKVD
jgi:heat shock protein HslJ